MEVTVKINSCSDCRHHGHSGAFTIRGARPVCGHSDSGVIRLTVEEFKKEYPEYKGESRGDFNYHWIHRITDRQEGIPEWCPLKHGKKY